MVDSGPNLAVRGFAALLIVVGVVLIASAYRIRRGRARMPLGRAATSMYAVGAFTVTGAGAIAFGVWLLAASS